MRIGTYKTYTSKKSLKGQYDEIKGTKRISGHGYQKDSAGTKKFLKKIRGIVKSDINYGYQYRNIKKYKAYKEEIDNIQNNISDSINNIIYSDILITNKFGEINFSNEKDLYFRKRNKLFFYLLDNTNYIDLKIFNGKISGNSLIYVEGLNKGTKEIETMPLFKFINILNININNYEEFIDILNDKYGITIKEIIKGYKKKKY